MATVISAGLLLCRRPVGASPTSGLEFFLVHPGGPFFAKKDAGFWSVPKGLLSPGEAPLAAAQREFREETGFALPAGPYLDLGQVRQKSGKQVWAFAVAGDADPAQMVSNTFTLQWPRGSGLVRSFPEVDRGAFFGLAEGLQKINEAQRAFLQRASQPDVIEKLFESRVSG